MKTLTWENFDSWMEAYGRASRENDAQASVDLFTQEAEYYETPFDAPMIGRDAIFRYWQKGTQTLTDKESTYEILSVKKNVGIAHWQSKFTVIESGKRLLLDCVFLVDFEVEGKCKVFREWWHIKAIDSYPANQENTS